MGIEIHLFLYPSHALYVDHEVTLWEIESRSHIEGGRRSKKRWKESKDGYRYRPIRKGKMSMVKSVDW